MATEENSLNDADLRGKCFISYGASQSGQIPSELNRMCKSLEMKGAAPFIFYAKERPKRRELGPALIAAIRRCSSLAFLETKQAEASPYVSLERLYAHRNGLNVFRYDYKTNKISADVSLGTHLPVAPVFVHADHSTVTPILHKLEERRCLLPSKLSAGEDFRSVVFSNIDRWLGSGGVILLFVSIASLRSEWVKKECSMGLQSSQIIPVILKETSMDELPLSRQLREFQFFRIGSQPVEQLADAIADRVNSVVKQLENDALDAKPFPLSKASEVINECIKQARH